LIIEFEKKHVLSLPEDFKYFCSEVNGFDLMGTEVYGFLPDSLTSMSIEKLYHREHKLIKFPQPEYLVPFSPDGSGDFYCFDTRSHNGGSCPVVFWYSNYNYTDEDVPEKANDSFVEWMQEVVIDWTLEDYDYDGNDRVNQ
ncbi:SMI1/KNR4 family protein, partial [Chitinophaga sp. Mgbs1]|nr:SMI1/KNR4 family protein [Chitinophaga solisilvae]